MLSTHRTQCDSRRHWHQHRHRAQWNTIDKGNITKLLSKPRPKGHPNVKEAKPHYKKL